CLASRQTGRGAIEGTASYMAPEQARGEPLTVAADIYGLGAVLYELLTGQPPFPGKDTWQIILQVRQNSPPRPRAIAAKADPYLESICLMCLKRAPEERYKTAEALAADLAHYLAYEPISALQHDMATDLQLAMAFLVRHKGLGDPVGLFLGAVSSTLSLGA